MDFDPAEWDELDEDDGEEAKNGDFDRFPGWDICFDIDMLGFPSHFNRFRLVVLSWADSRSMLANPICRLTFISGRRTAWNWRRNLEHGYPLFQRWNIISAPTINSKTGPEDALMLGP